MKTCWISFAVLSALCTSSTSAFIFSAQVHPALESISHVTPGTAFRTRLDFDYSDSSGHAHKLVLTGPTLELLNEPKKSTIPLPNANGAFANLSTGSKAVKILQEAFFVGMQGACVVYRQNRTMTRQNRRKTGLHRSHDSQTLPLYIAGMQEVPFEKGCKWERTLRRVFFVTACMYVSSHHAMRLICTGWEMAWVDEQREGQLICAFNLPMPVCKSEEQFSLVRRGMFLTWSSSFAIHKDSTRLCKRHEW